MPDNEAAGRSGLQPLPAALKLGATLLLVVSIALLPRRPHVVFLLPAVLLLLFWVLARMPVLYALRRLAVAQIFIAGLAVLWIFSTAAVPLILSIFIKSNLSIIAVLLLAWSTPFHEILQVLRHGHVSPVLLTTLALMYRYLPLLAEESVRMQRARASRTFSRSSVFAWHTLSDIIAQLFIRSINRAERIYLAMCARGWK